MCNIKQIIKLTINDNRKRERYEEKGKNSTTTVNKKNVDLMIY